MPLILLCGYPSSGKTYRANQIVSYLEQKIASSPNQANHVNGGGAAGDSNNVVSTTQVLSALNLKEATLDSSAAPTTTVSSESSPAPNTNQPESSSTAQSRIPSKAPSEASRISRKIHYISDHTLGIPRSAYLTAKAEKEARGVIYAVVKRVLTRNDIVVLDTGNYIKGWRYQLYCEAKNVGTASCVIHVGVSEDKCRQVNQERLQRLERDSGNTTAQKVSPAEDEFHRANQSSTNSDTRQINPRPGLSLSTSSLELNGSSELDPYSQQIFEELLMRFEEPNAMTRWDSPLYTIPWTDPSPPNEEIWTEVIQGVGKDGRTKVIRPNQAAVLTPATAPSHLYNLERTTQAIISTIQTYQQAHDNCEGDTLPIPVEAQKERAQLEITLPATLSTFPHLQRLRRQFIALHRQQMGGMGMGGVGGGHGAAGMSISPGRVAELFVEFLNERFAE